MKLHTKAIPLLALALVIPGCIGTDADEDDPAPTGRDAGDAADEAVGPVTDTLQGDIVLSVATPVRTVNNGGAFAHPLDRSANDTGYVLEIVWAPATPLSEELDVWIRLTGVGNLPPDDPMTLVDTPAPIARATGASPLRVPLAASDFPDDEDYEIIVRASSGAGVGAAANQPFEILVTTFPEGVAFDPEYSAAAEA